MFQFQTFILDKFWSWNKVFERNGFNLKLSLLKFFNLLEQLPKIKMPMKIIQSVSIISTAPKDKNRFPQVFLFYFSEIKHQINFYYFIFFLFLRVNSSRSLNNFAFFSRLQRLSSGFSIFTSLSLLSLLMDTKGKLLIFTNVFPFRSRLASTRKDLLR